MNKKVKVKPYKRKNKKNDGEHRVKGHTRRLGGRENISPIRRDRGTLDTISQREIIEDKINADRKIVSKHDRLLNKIREQFEANAGSGEEVGNKEYIAKTDDYGGLEIYADSQDELWAGDETWVVPIDISSYPKE